MPRRTLPFLTLTITWWLSLVPAGWAQQDGQDTGVDGAPGPIVARAARAPDSHRLKRNYAHTPIALTITLPPITRAQQAASTETEEPERPGPLQIGFGRDVPDTDRGDLAPRLAWETQSDGSQVSALSVSSPGARAVRVALRGTLAAGAEVLFFSPADPEQRFPPVQPADISPGLAAEAPAGAPAEESAPLWSPVVEGDTVGVEISLPSPTAVSDVSLFIDRVSHLSASVRQAAPQRLSAIGRAASCNIDVACRSTTPQNLARATAKMIYTKPTGFSFLCTGVLLNDADGSSFIPYFLTANHCINTQTVARTLNTYWRFERASCGGSTPTEVHQLTGGADLLETDSGADATLLRLRETPSGETWYAGWDTRRLRYPAQVIGIHHPQGDLKKWVRGRATRDVVVSLIGTRQIVASVNVEWTEGTVEGGSSGSGLFDTRGRLRGVFSSTPVDQTSCDSERRGYYGRLDVFAPRICRWLNPDHCGGGSVDPPDLVVAQPSVSDTRLAPGQSFELSATVRNLGGGTSENPELRYYLSRDRRISPGDWAVGVDTVRNIGAWGTVDEDIDLKAPTMAGKYYYGACVAAVSGECETRNNCSAGRRITVRVDDHPDRLEDIHRTIPLNSGTSGVLERRGDVDYFRVEIPQRGQLRVETTGSTDTIGCVSSPAGWLVQDDDAGTNDNFRIVQNVTRGTYFIAVSGHQCGATGANTAQGDLLAGGGGGSAEDDHGSTEGRQ